jgi:putative flippase GtrA
MRFRQLLSFASIGGIAFFLDAITLTALMHLGVGAYLGRGLSWIAAVTFTWYLNRQWTFKGVGGGARPLAQWGRFVLSNSVGGALNLLVYGVLVFSIEAVKAAPWLGVAAGSIAGLLCNFILSTRFAFREN